MARKDYNNIQADYIIIKFRCNCEQIINTGLMPVSERCDHSKEINVFSQDKKIVCSKCHKEYKIVFYDYLYSSYCEIEGLEDDKSIIYLHEIPYEYANHYDNAFIDYIEELGAFKGILSTVENSDTESKQFFLRMILTYAISIMDSYLGNTFRYYVNHFDLFQRNYLQFKGYKTKARKMDILKRLDSQSFQNLKVIAPYYKNTFGIVIPQNDIIQRATEKRNTIIHNNSREKDGYKNCISLEELQILIKEIERMVREVNINISTVVVEQIWCKNQNI